MNTKVHSHAENDSANMCSRQNLYHVYHPSVSVLTFAKFDSIPPNSCGHLFLQTTNVDLMAALKIRIIFYASEYLYNLA